LTFKKPCPPVCKLTRAHRHTYYHTHTDMRTRTHMHTHTFFSVACECMCAHLKKVAPGGGSSNVQRSLHMGAPWSSACACPHRRQRRTHSRGAHVSALVPWEQRIRARRQRRACPHRFQRCTCPYGCQAGTHACAVIVAQSG